jgi:hypothetical protein
MMNIHPRKRKSKPEENLFADFFRPTLPSHGDHELALDVAFQPQKKQTPRLRSAETFKVRDIELAPRTQSTKKTSSANSQIHAQKKENRHLQIKHVGCILHLGEIREFLPKNRPDHSADASGLSPAVSKFEMMFQPNRRLTRLLLSTLLS